MNDKKETSVDKDTAFMDWDNVMGEYWNSVTKPWSEILQNFGSQEQGKGRVTESMQTSLDTWQTMMGSMSHSSTVENFQKATELTPDIVLGFAQTCMQGFVSLQSKAGEWIQKRGASLSTADIQELDRELIKNVADTYEKEFRRYLKVPQLGMGRLYQERALQAVDKLNSLQLSLSEFLQMLYLPIEKSFNSLQKEMTQMTEAGSVDEKSKTYYNLWIKLLEGHYMELFKQPEYAEAMGKTLWALNEFSEAKQAVLNDVLKQQNIPTYQDLDDLSKEIYLLKKRVRELERKG